MPVDGSNGNRRKENVTGPFSRCSLGTWIVSVAYSIFTFNTYLAGNPSAKHFAGIDILQMAKHNLAKSCVTISCMQYEKTQYLQEHNEENDQGNEDDRTDDNAYD